MRTELPEEVRGLVLPAAAVARRRESELREPPLATSVEALDRLLGGGLPRGGLVELVGRGSSGRFAAILGAVAAVTSAGEAAVLVDQGGQLDPRAAAGMGVDLERLLWLRPERLPDALAAAEMLLATGVPLVALDLGLPPVRGRAPLAAWLRLARGAADHRTAVVVGSPYRLSGCAAAAVVTSRGRGRWSGAPGAPRLLEGVAATLCLDRRRGHRSEEREHATLHVAESVPAGSPGDERRSHHADDQAVADRRR